MRELAVHFEEAFRQIGVQLGHELAQMILERQAPQPLHPAPSLGLRRSGPPSSQRVAKILPGLTGRRRKPGEDPPRCGKSDCDRRARTRGYCQTHYVQWLKAGGGVRSYG